MTASASLFISDLHLTPLQPALADCLCRFIANQARTADAVYILGDLFDVWLGDDDLASPFSGDIVSALRDLTDAGVALHIMHGNRDFFLGDDFAKACGAQILPDPTRIELHNLPALLTHGDNLCSDDLASLSFRDHVRRPAWRAEFLAKPLAERRDWAAQLRARSELAKGSKNQAIMDVNDTAVQAAFREHACTMMIHGHTHRPKHHRLEVDGHTCERWVLPDWQTTPGYLHCDATGCRLIELDCATAQGKPLQRTQT